MKAKATWIWAVMMAAGVHIEAGTIADSALITSNLQFYLKRQFGLATNQFRAEEQIDYVIAPIPATNEVFYRRFPFPESFDFHLFSQTGQEIPKSRQGLANSREVHAPKSIDEAARLKGRTHLVEYTLFRPQDMFVISNGGTYELEVRLRLWAQTTNNIPNYEPLMFNDNFVKEFIADTNAHFGVVISQPVRVKVIKE
jgi:hypothetical protein